MVRDQRVSQETRENTWSQEQDYRRDSSSENFQPRELGNSTVPGTHRGFNK